MSETHDKSGGGFRVVGPCLGSYQQTTWRFPSLSEARKFAESIAQSVDAEYHIFQHVGTVRQVPLPPRPVEYLEAPAS